jgi:hypothetical protein
MSWQWMKSVLVCLACVAMTYCKAYDGSQAIAPTDGDMVMMVAGAASAFAVIQVGTTLDDMVIKTLTDPKIAPEKKKVLRCLNVGYSLAKLGIIVGIGKALPSYLDQCARKSDRVNGVAGALSAAGLVLASLAKTVLV